MALEDYYDACLFRAHGVPPMDEWVDELRAEAALRTCLDQIP